MSGTIRTGKEVLGIWRKMGGKNRITAQCVEWVDMTYCEDDRAIVTCLVNDKSLKKDLIHSAVNFSRYMKLEINRYKFWKGKARIN